MNSEGWVSVVLFAIVVFAVILTVMMLEDMHNNDGIYSLGQEQEDTAR